VVCWGSNQYGQCGTGSTSTTSLPTTVANLPVATGVAANTYSTCAVSGGTQMMCWGDDTLGELGDSQTGTGSSTPVLVK
jgi:alpha-tubulin suppressor-like RCC1 family protein